MSKLPGYVSANLHKGLDGRHVVNYAQWRTREDFEAMLRNPGAMPHMKVATELATSVAPGLYIVAFTDGASL